MNLYTLCPCELKYGVETAQRSPTRKVSLHDTSSIHVTDYFQESPPLHYCP